METLLRALAVCFVAWGIPGFGQDADTFYDIETAEVDGEVIRYVRDELLVKPTLGTDVSKLAAGMDAAVLDSIPDIRWYRLRFLGNHDALPSWHGTQDDARVEAACLHVMSALPDDGDGEESALDEVQCPPENEIQWPITYCGADQAWAQVPQSDAIIAILDTGVDQAHVMAVEFQGCDRIEVGRDWYHHRGGEFRPAWDTSYDGHGTKRAGEIAAPYDGEGIAGIIAGSYGVNGLKCRVLIEKIAQDVDHVSVWAMAQALMYAVGARDARVVSLSYTGVTPTTTWYTLLRDTFYTINSQRQNTVIVCCSGNSGGNTGKDENPCYLTYPAAWSCELACVIAVGASDRDDSVNTCTEWRQGPCGGELSMLGPAETGAYCSTTRNGLYTADGIGQTSSGTAFVSGVAGMLIAKEPGLFNYQIKDRLQNTAFRVDLPPPFVWDWFRVDCWGHHCWSERAGCGRVDALRCLDPGAPVQCPYPKEGCGAGASQLGGTAMAARLEVFDLLGRRLWMGRMSDGESDPITVTSYIRLLPGLPLGAKIVRVLTPTEVRTWRVAP